MDFALNSRRALIESACSEETERIAQEADQARVRVRNEAKRRAAVASMGRAYVLHPDYRRVDFPHHSLAVKTSSVLGAFMSQRRAVEQGRV